MWPQGSGPINTDYFDSLIDQVDAAADSEAPTACADLQSLVTQTFASISAQLSAISAQASSIYNQAEAIIEAYTSIGADPTPASIVTFLKVQIEQALGPGYAAYAVYVEKLTALSAQITALTNAINNQRIPSCTITIPSVTIPSLPSLPSLP